MNRASVLLHAKSIREHAEIVEQIVGDPNSGGRDLDREVIGRCNAIGAATARLRAETLGRHLHVLGERDPEAAA